VKTGRSRDYSKARGKKHDSSLIRRSGSPADPGELKEETARLKEKFDTAPGLVTILVGQIRLDEYVTAKQKAPKSSDSIHPGEPAETIAEPIFWPD